MDCQRPIKNEKTNKWEVWDFVYEEKGKRYYELHEFWQTRNLKNKNGTKTN